MNVSVCRIIAGGTAAIVLGAAGLLHAEAPLLSPWDAHPPAPHPAPYTCPSPPALPHDIVAYDFYSDSKHSVIDPKRYAAYKAAQDQFSQVVKAAEEAADNYQRTGNTFAATCVKQILATQATANAMTGSMSSNQANYVQNWTLGALAISYLKVRKAGPYTLPATPLQDPVQLWMKTVGKQVEDWFDDRRVKKTVDSQNNHHYWAGFAVMAAGIAADDHGLYDWGVGTYKDGVDRIAPDGTLPLEMARGQRALHYHLFALAPLVTMAELGEVNGDGLYAYGHNALHQLVSRATSGLVDNHYFTDKAGVAQDTPEDGKIKSADIIWVTPYLRRFPDPAIQSLLKQGGNAPYGYLGGMPPS